MGEAGEVTALLTEEGRVTGVQTDHRGCLSGPGGGDLLRDLPGGKTILGSVAKWAGPDGMFGANHLTESLRRLGLTSAGLRRARPPVNARSIDFSQLECQVGDEDVMPFSFETEKPRAQPGVLPHHLYQRENPRHHPGQPGPVPPLLRGH